MTKTATTKTAKQTKPEKQAPASKAAKSPGSAPPPKAAKPAKVAPASAPAEPALKKAAAKRPAEAPAKAATEKIAKAPAKAAAKKVAEAPAKAAAKKVAEAPTKAVAKKAAAPSKPVATKKAAAAPAKPPTVSVVEQFAAKQKFPLDEFQLEAMRALENGRSVLVSAPTGSGKTIVAEFAIFLARHNGRRCIYTTPLKALSNQKFRDLRQDMGDNVGLVTGDVVINPEAPVLIMTTEILRNMLQVDPTQVDDVSHVVLDEAHYIGADGRGTVWEETIVFLGKDTRIVALSATIPNADELATWVSEVHMPMDVILHEERPVPLEPYVFVEKAEALFDKRGRLRVKSFGRERDGWVEEPLSSQVVRDLHQKGMTPAIFFVFSRLGCEREAIETIRTGGDLTSKAEKKAIEKAVQAAIAQTPGMMTSNATKAWLERMPSGVAPHHAGLLPPLKLLIEELFQHNLLKVVFATETLAAGINMPARTVVVTSLSKRTDEGHRMLTVGEFAQMTGRAGRRGMDTVGYGVVYGSHRYSVNDVAALFQGQAEPLRSRFTLNYNMVINLTHQYEESQARRIVEQCFSQFQNNATVGHLRTLRDHAKLKLEGRDARCPRFPDKFERGVILPQYLLNKRRWDEATDAVKDFEKNLRGQNEKEAERAILAAPYNSVVVVKRAAAPRAEIAILLDKYKSKKGIQFGALLGTGHVVRLAGRDLVLSTGAAVKDVPKDLRWVAEPMSYLQLKKVKLDPREWQGWLDRAGIDPESLIPPAKEPPKLVAARRLLAEAEADWQAATCFNCPKLNLCKAEEKELIRLRKDVRSYEEQIEAIRGKFWQQFRALRTVLERADFLRGRELLPRGVALANLRTQNELVAADTFASGLLERLDPAELAAVVSVMIAEPPRGRMAWRPLRYSQRVYNITEQMVDLATHLDKIEERVQKEFGDPNPSCMVATEYAGMVQAWASGHQWAHVVEMAGIDEGQLVRHLRQVIDMLNQIKDVPGNSRSFVERAMEAIAAVDRDIVKEVF